MGERFRVLGLVATVLLVAGCVAYTRPPPPPPPRPLSAPQAVAIATSYARSRGLVVDYTHEVRFDRRGRWHVDLGGAAGRDRAIVTLDGFSGAVLAARLRGARGEIAPPPAPPPAGGPQQPPPAGGPQQPPPQMPPEPSAPPPPGPETPPPPPNR
jgi:hypothetical protein